MKADPDTRDDGHFGPVDRFFLDRIDRALDDARPLDAWTDWYARHRPRLWAYYEAMLAMELELRFPDTENSIPVAKTARPEQSRPSREKRNRPAWTICLTAGILFVLATAVSFFFRYSSRPAEPAPHRAGSGTEEFREGKPFTPDQRMDLADWTSLLAASFSEVVPPPESPLYDPFHYRPLVQEWPTWEHTVEPLVEFTEKPLESTLAFLERIQILRHVDASPVEMENQEMIH